MSGLGEWGLYINVGFRQLYRETVRNHELCIENNKICLLYSLWLDVGEIECGKVKEQAVESINNSLTRTSRVVTVADTEPSHTCFGKIKGEIQNKGLLLSIREMVGENRTHLRRMRFLSLAVFKQMINSAKFVLDLLGSTCNV